MKEIEVKTNNISQCILICNATKEQGLAGGEAAIHVRPEQGQYSHQVGWAGCGPGKSSGYVCSAARGRREKWARLL